MFKLMKNGFGWKNGVKIVRLESVSRLRFVTREEAIEYRKTITSKNRRRFIKIIEIK
ncbi:MAG: hypothetical protein M1576_04170 [Deltaproteobacteria bacterium]|nr:hypothetical protein [Deltaproteobacteria bacterium]